MPSPSPDSTPTVPADIADTALDLRTATLADTALVADMHARSWSATYRGILSDAFLDGPMPAERLAHWRARMPELLANGGQTLIAERAGEAVGFVCMFAMDAQASVYVDNLHATPDRKGLGTGTALLAAAARWARVQGARRLLLYVVVGNLPAIGFYESRGWRCIDRRNDVMGGEPVGEWVYEFALDGDKDGDVT